jgi:hypothetical protein
MPVVSNKTRKPLSVPLPGGKTLHLGPGKTGQISARAIEDPRLKKLVDAGEIELIIEDSRSAAAPGGGAQGRNFKHGRTSRTGGRRSGDR